MATTVTTKSFTLTKQNVIDTAKRVGWTFAQAALGVLLITNQPLSKATLIAAVAAGISAVKNIILSGLSQG